MSMTLNDHLTQLWARLSEVERRQANQIRHAPVTDVDAAKQLCRVRLNPDSEKTAFKSAWIPYAQMAAPDGEGESGVKGFKFHNPPTVGQNMTLFSPSGDPGQAIAVPLTWSEKAPSPSDKPDEHIMTFGKFKMTITKDKAIVELGQTKVTWEDETLTFEGKKGQFKMSESLKLEDGASDAVLGDTGSVSNNTPKVFVKATAGASPTAKDTQP